MAVARDTRRWIRKVDGDMHIVGEQPVVRLYPTTLDEVVESVREARDSPGNSEARAIGSHWAMSHTGVTRGFMIETASPVHEPKQPPTSKRLNNPLYDVIPGCLTDIAKEFFHRQNVPTFDPSQQPTLLEIYLFHVEAGMRIHELYSLIDKGDRPDDGRSLAHLMANMDSPADYSGPWALETMGGAGGQTIAGAFSTGTHGGDLGLGALADQVVAVHLVDANCQQHWIERTRLRQGLPQFNLVDKAKLKDVYSKIEYHNDDDLMNAVTVACGRMGMIYSVVLRVVRQYALDETRTQEDWDNVKQWIGTANAPAFVNRFVQMAINPYGHMFDPSRHTVYVNTRLLKPLNAAGVPPLGRQERGVNPGKNKHLGFTDDFFSGLCGTNHVISKALDQLLADTRDMRAVAIKAWAVAAVAIIFPLTPPHIKAAAFAAQQAAAATIVWCSGMISLLWYLLKDALPALGGRLSDEMSCVLNVCADVHLGFFVIRFAMCRQHDAEFPQNDPNDPHTPAISYAAMDQHDYTNVGCVAPGDSIEVFFDRFDPQLVKFLDRVLARARQLENGELTADDEAFGGYISVRFMGRAEALLSMQRWPQTCAIEIAGLSMVDGTDPFIKQIERDAIDMGGVLHWGQRNEDWEMKQVEKFYDPTGPSGRLFRWREALSQFTNHGRYDVFSTAYSKQRGLEITKPRIQRFGWSLQYGCADEETFIDWVAVDNPPETAASLIVTPKNGTPQRIPLAALHGNRKIPLGLGRSTLTFRLDRVLHGAPFSDEQSVDIEGFGPGHDALSLVFMAQPHVIDLQVRWGVVVNLSGGYLSNKLLVTAIQSTFSGVPAWIVRNAGFGDLSFTTTLNHLAVPVLPTLASHWLVFAANPGTQGPSPELRLSFQLTCQQ